MPDGFGHLIQKQRETHKPRELSQHGPKEKVPRPNVRSTSDGIED